MSDERQLLTSYNSEQWHLGVSGGRQEALEGSPCGPVVCGGQLEVLGDCQLRRSAICVCRREVLAGQWHHRSAVFAEEDERSCKMPAIHPLVEAVTESDLSARFARSDLQSIRRWCQGGAQQVADPHQRGDHTAVPARHIQPPCGAIAGADHLSPGFVG